MLSKVDILKHQFNSALGLELRKLRLSKNYSAEDIAKLLCCDISEVFNIEFGLSAISSKITEKIHEIFDIQMRDFVTESLNNLRQEVESQYSEKEMFEAIALGIKFKQIGVNLLNTDKDMEYSQRLQIAGEMYLLFYGA